MSGNPTPDYREAWLAQQQLELEQTAAPIPGSTPNHSSKGLGLILVAIPVLSCALTIAWHWTPHNPRKSKSFWDGVLGKAASVSGRKYNSEANSLTEMLTFNK